MPEVILNATDAAELAECCNSSANGWPKIPPTWAPRSHSSPATPPTIWTNCAATWNGSPFLLRGSNSGQLVGP
jgi:hypothetical protein